jgi:hypothetical protein
MTSPSRLIRCLLLGLFVQLALPTAGQAFKPKTDIYLADQATALIFDVRANKVNIGGNDYPVPAAVGDALRSHPKDFRGGLIGAYGFPDLTGGWGAIQPDTRTNNGTVNDRGPGNGHAFSREWLQHIYNSAWAEWKACHGCRKAKRSLAFTYGFLMNAAGDVFGHTVANDVAGGAFPIGTTNFQLAVRHIVAEEYVARHTPPAETTIDSPTEFVNSTFIHSDTAAALGRGPLIESILGLRAKVSSDRAKINHQIDGLVGHCLARSFLDGHCIQRGPLPGDLGKVALLELEQGLLGLWVPIMDAGIRNFPVAATAIARALFILDIHDVAKNMIQAVVESIVAGKLTKLVATGLIGKVINQYGTGPLVHAVSQLNDFIDREIQQLASPLLNGREGELLSWLLRYGIGGGGGGYVFLLPYFIDPALYIGNGSIGFSGDTPTKLDALMGLTTNGVNNQTIPFDGNKFAAAQDTVTMMKLALLDGNGLNQVLADHGVPPRYNNDTDTNPTENVMLGWIRSLAGDHQWRARSPRDGRQYGEGNFPLWQDCLARNNVFRLMFKDWENGSQNFPDQGDHPRGCHDWTTANEEEKRFSISVGPAPDGSDSVLFRLRGRELTPIVFGGSGTSGGSPPKPHIPHAPAARKAILRPLDVPGAQIAGQYMVGTVLARRHLGTPAERVSFTYESGGDAHGLGLEVDGDGRRLTSTAQPGPVTLDNVGAREIDFRLNGPVLPPADRLGAARSSFFARISHVTFVAAGWDTTLSPDVSGVDTDSLAQQGDAASASFVADPGPPLAGSALATRHYLSPFDTVTFHYRPQYDPSVLELTVLVGGQPVTTLSGPAHDVTLPGLNARDISFRWRALKPAALDTPQSAQITNLTATAGALPMTPTGPPPPPPPSPTAGSGLDLQAPVARGFRVRVTRSAARQTVQARFRLSEPGTVALRVLKGTRQLAATRSRRVGTGSTTLTLSVRPSKSGTYVAEVAALDRAGNLGVARKKVKLAGPPKRHKRGKR